MTTNRINKTLPKTLTEDQEIRLETANIVAKATDDLCFKWWLNAHTETSYRGQWENNRGYGSGREMFDEPTIDELFDKALARYEGQACLEFFQNFEERNKPLLKVLNFCKKNVPEFKCDRRTLYIDKRIECRYTTKSGLMTISFFFYPDRGNGAAIRMWCNNQKHFSTDTLEWFQDVAEVSSVFTPVKEYAQSIGMKFEKVR